MSVCVILSTIFCKLINQGSCGATRLFQILFQIGRKKNIYGVFSDVATGLWRGLFETYAMSRVVPAFQIRKNVRRIRPPKSGRPSTSMDDDHVEEVLAVIRQIRRLSVREAAEDVGICKSSYHLILTEERKIRRVAAKVVPRLLTWLS